MHMLSKTVVWVSMSLDLFYSALNSKYKRGVNFTKLDHCHNIKRVQFIPVNRVTQGLV